MLFLLWLSTLVDLSLLGRLNKTKRTPKELLILGLYFGFFFGKIQKILNWMISRFCWREHKLSRLLRFFVLSLWSLVDCWLLNIILLYYMLLSRSMKSKIFDGRFRLLKLFLALTSYLVYQNQDQIWPNIKIIVVLRKQFCR